ncbi:MAG: exosortase/archaeosortase family protein [Verrucomicrobia bacterium]|nr:exosortase/archaeosortase family protein [Verrucomicrobiota bacterium]
MPGALTAVRRYGEWGQIAAVALLVAALFHFLGLRYYNSYVGQSAWLWIFEQWVRSDGDFTHGWTMPFIALYVVWSNRKAIASAPKSTCAGGLIIVIGALLLHVAAFRVQQPRISLIAMTILVWGGILFVYGWATAKVFLFPVGYMILAFASFWLIAITFKLRLFACMLSGAVLNGIGIETVRYGTALYSQAGGGFNFDVADPCSGLRSLVVMTALAAPFAYFTSLSNLRKWVLFATSIPLAVLANILRIVSIALLAELAGQELAMRVFHDFSGSLVFFIAILLLVGTSQLLKKELWKGDAPSTPTELPH